MRRAILALMAASAACTSSPASPPVTDAGTDTSSPPADVAQDTTPVDPGALRYRPAGCDYDVSTSRGTTDNRMGDDATFGADPTPRGVRVNWPGPPTATAAVLWNTDAATLATVVEYGTSMTSLDRTARGHVSTAH